MLTLPADCLVYIYHPVVDMRKSIDGLVVLVVEQMTLSPREAALFLFRNGRGDKVKAIIWDSNGFVLLYKRLEKGRFCFPKTMADSVYCIDGDLLHWLLKGFDFYRIKQYPEMKISQYF